MLASTGKTTVGVSVAMIFLATMAIALRFAAKYKGKVKFRMEDWLIILAYLTFTAFMAMTFQIVAAGGGTLDLGELGFPAGTAKLDAVLYWSYFAEALFVFSITFTKFSVLLFFRTIFSTATFKRQSWGLMGLCGAWFIVWLFVDCFKCTPVSAAWTLELQQSGSAKCLVWGDLLVGLEASNIFLDLCIIGLPLAHLRTIKMDMARKIVIGVIFGLVLIVCVFGAIRIYYLQGDTFENTAALSNGTNWTAIELSVAILCACLPCYGPLVQLNKLWSKSPAAMPNSRVSKKQTGHDQRLKHSSDKEIPKTNKNGLSPVDDNDDAYPLRLVQIQHEFTIED